LRQLLIREAQILLAGAMVLTVISDADRQKLWVLVYDIWLMSCPDTVIITDIFNSSDCPQIIRSGKVVLPGG
jgi:hypothetical protein